MRRWRWPLVENVVRTDLDPIEEARAYARLCDEMGLTQANVAEAVGRSRVAVTNALRLLDLPDEVICDARAPRAERGARTSAPARARSRDRRRLAREAVRQSWSVRALETAARAAAGRREPTPTRRRAGTPAWLDAAAADDLVDAAYRRARPSRTDRDRGRERPARAAHTGCERARGAPRCARGRWYAQSSPGRLAQSVRAPL